MNIQNKSKKSDWLIPIGLILLCLIPILGGVARIHNLLNDNKITPENARFFSAPATVIIHIVCSCLYGIFGALQFSHGFRKQRPHWHRRFGKLLIVLGLASSTTGLYLTQFFPHIIEGDGPTLYYIRLSVGITMTLSILFAIQAIRKRNFQNHGEWMIRAYALGLGAGTQVFTHLPWIVFIGTLPTGYARDLAMGSGWLINYIIAEGIIRRKTAKIKL